MTTPIFIVTAGAKGLSSELCPFPGIASYDLDQRDSFKGREQETIELARIILTQRLTVLTAGSGDGKTSLIHAGLAPLLMREGIEMAVAEPGGQSPIEEIGNQLLTRILPFASDNLGALKWLSRRGLGDSLREARAALVRELQGGIAASAAASDPLAALPPEWPAQRPLDLLKGGPLRTWLTNGDFPDRLVDASMSAVALQCGGKKPPEWPGLDSTVAEAIRFFEQIPARCERSRLDRKVLPDRFRNIVQKQVETAFSLHRARPGYEVVLVVDQFEEAFVQFRGAGPAFAGDQASDRRQHREAALALLATMIRRSDWPLRVVISMRKEHYAELDAAFLQAMEAGTYHLAPLHKEQARASLNQLAPEPRGDQDADDEALAKWQDFVTKALDQLTAGNDGQWVDATQLSSLGRWLWRKPLPDDVEGAVKEALVRQVAGLLAIPGQMDAEQSTNAEHAVRGGMGQGPPLATTLVEQQEAIDILAQLRIPYGEGGGRRISLPIRALETRAWRNKQFTRKMIERLRRARLIRQDKRHEHDYIEIVHERMIDVIDNLLQRWKDPRYSELDDILEFLRSGFRVNPFSRIPLTMNQFLTLAVNRERIALSDFAASRIVEAVLASPFLWKSDDASSMMAADFLQWLASSIDSETAKIVAINPDTGKGAQAITERAQAAWRAGELASPVLAEAVRNRAIGLEEDEQRTWLLTSSLLHGREGEKRLEELAAKI